MKKKIRILLPEGSSFSARQALTALGREGYLIDVCDPNPICICRFSKFLHKFYLCPKFGTVPIGYYNFVLQLLQKGQYDVLLPIHEQAFIFSKNYKTISEYVNIVISNFDSFGILQSKVAFMQLLQNLNIPHPESHFLKTKIELENFTKFPIYIKLPYGTAGHGTWKVECKSDLNNVLIELETNGILINTPEILVQQEVTGVLCVAQSLFNHGELIGIHCYQLCSEGVGGSASARIGVNHSNVIKHVAEIGSSTKWHGCFMLDYIYDGQTETPYYIEANPRPGETMNATLSGFNIIEKLTKLSLNTLPENSSGQKFGIKTHGLLASLLGIASRRGSRKEIMSEIIDAILKRTTYRNSCEELTNIRDDFYSIIPLTVVIFQLLVNPNSAKKIAAKTIANYSISADTIKKINLMDIL